MASFAVPDLYGKSILEEDLAVEQSTAQVEIQCRQQLSLIHTLLPNGLTGDYSSSQVVRGVRSHTGRRGIAQELEIQANSSTCNAFSMRAYVGSIRELDVNKCWPFRSHLMKRRTEESPNALLPALKVPRYKYWECSECVDNCPHYVSSYENQIAEQHTDDSIHDKPCTTDKAESLRKLPKNDHAFLGSVMQNPVSVTMSFDTSPKEEAGVKAGQKTLVDIHSVESSFENGKEVCRKGDDVVSNSPVEPDDSIKGEATSFTKISKNECTVVGPYLVPISANTFREETIDNTKDSTPIDISSGKSSFENDKEVQNGDDVVQSSPVEHLTSQKISEDDLLYSINETIACNATLWTTDSKVNSDATQTFCTNSEDQVFANRTGNHIRTESKMSDFVQKEEHLPHISVTVKLLVYMHLD